MGTYSFEQVTNIVLKNPNKKRIEEGRKTADKLLMHLQGRNLDSQLDQCKHFEDDEIYKVRKQYALSNKDLFGRLLQQEEMVFTARGGSVRFNLSEQQEEQMNEILGSVKYGISLRKWIQEFALKAYRADPMGVIFIEVDPVTVDGFGQLNEPKAYPTYKSIYCIFDYLPNGRKLEYICFQLSAADAIGFGIQDKALNDQQDKSKPTTYYRFVDDAKDLIVQNKDGQIILVTNITQRNPLANEWNRTPAFINSDLMRFDDPMTFLSPLDLVVELADCFLRDRSVRELQKKHHGFSKPVEPLLKCSTCDGHGFVAGSPCKDCTPPSAEKGTGFKLKTKPSDVARFPLTVFEGSSFDFNKIFGYVSPDIEGWEKQDMSLADLEELMFLTYWGSHRQQKDQKDKSQETATAKFIDTQPVYTRLGTTADWAEKTEAMIADFLGEYWFDGSFKKSSIAYGRYYILESPDELMVKYLEMRTKGAPDFALDESMEKYLQAKYQSNPGQLAKYMKMLDVEPFPHITSQVAKGIITDFTDFNCKLYFGEWSNTIADVLWWKTPAPVLREMLKEYVAAKGIKEPQPEPAPSF